MASKVVSSRWWQSKLSGFKFWRVQTIGCSIQSFFFRICGSHGLRVKEVEQLHCSPTPEYCYGRRISGNGKKTCQGNDRREFGKHHFEHKNLAPKSFKIVFVCRRYSLTGTKADNLFTKSISFLKYLHRDRVTSQT